MKKKTLQEELEEVFGPMEIIDINPGNLVICDGCNDNYTNSEEVGGVLLSRTAFCPKCCKEIIESAKEFEEERFLTYPKEGETFKDFVLRMRHTPSDYQR